MCLHKHWYVNVKGQICVAKAACIYICVAACPCLLILDCRVCSVIKQEDCKVCWITVIGSNMIIPIRTLSVAASTSMKRCATLHVPQCVSTKVEIVPFDVR